MFMNRIVLKEGKFFKNKTSKDNLFKAKYKIDSSLFLK
ncbi:hypothetical protein LEP1GSC016_0899 [Leptospira borgpetersenii serovar Hardjo-bovis str. Sponselee]|uniref:Uncharacterized protein n=2 Tax=Leptospira borgpetersenii TaxID=174 RepID=M6BIW1_LEPBO|nr:hypothetical protein LEP1GSC016_0899 [Leptospira borgpetersenii serovar Hardjo-bovis str. Sponselee]EMO62479.1 hypothetical protein LEP1GSC133_1802 [Leptospira borgpetersenii serovar Pomona str. 200901868]